MNHTQHKFYHCLPDRISWMEMCPNMLKVLGSAYRIRKFPRMKKHLHLAKEIMLDSGMISAWQAGRVEWMNNQEYVVNLAWEINADYTVMLDLPMEPELLKKNEFYARKAMSITLRNALNFIDMDVPGKKVFVIQGYGLAEYQLCINQYQEYGIFDIPNVLIGIGSVCRRSPKKGLYSICKFIRKRLPHNKLHAFGIGSLEYMKNLIDVGIDTFDSSYASISTVFNRGIYRVEGKRNIQQVDFQFANEMVDYELKTRRLFSKGQK